MMNLNKKPGNCNEIMAVLCLLATTVLAPGPAAAVNASVVDSSGAPFSQGVLNGYYVNAPNGDLVCVNPFVIGRYISCNDHVLVKGRAFTASSFQRVWVDTNGFLGGMAVVDRNNNIVCEDSTVYNQFRGPESYIGCQ